MTKTKTKTIDVNRNSPFFLPYDLMSPGIAIPGDDALEYARDMDDGVSQVQGKGKSAKLVDVGPALRELYSDILYRPRTLFRLTCNANQRKTVETVPGHLWGGEVAGPVPADVMVVGKMLGYDEIKARRNLVGPSGELLTEIFSELGVRDLDGWYVTTMVKCQHPDGGRDLKSGWVKAFRPVLQMEMRVVRPKYILCLGADAACEVLGRKVSVSGMDGRVEELTYPIHRTHDDPPEFHTALVMVCTHPAAVLAAPEQREQLEFSLGRFAQLVRGERFDLHEEGLDHRVVDNLDDLQNLVEEVIHSEESYLDPGVATIAIDAEWHGEHPQNAGSYLRTIQVSWAHKTAACVVLRHAGGAEAMPWDEVKTLLEMMLKSTPAREVRICGHFLNADMEWLLYMGLDLRAEFAAAENWEDTKVHGGFDTGLAAHALRETGDYGLEKLALRYTTAPRWDLPLEKWKVEFCRQHKLKPKDLEGYGEIDGSILYSYANMDADVTRRLAVKFNEMLDKDRFGNSCRKAFWISMRAAPSVLEIHTTGLRVDRERVDRLTLAYMAAHAKFQEKLRTWAKWPEFNINSVFHVREFLFGAELNGKRDKLDPNKVVRVRPKGARSLKLQPIYDTSKRPMLWTEVVEKGLQREKSPGTAKNILSLLAQESQAIKRRVNGQVVEIDYSPQVSWIRDHRFVGQVLKSCLRPPKLVEAEEGEEEDSFVQDVDGHYVYRGGLAGSICDDGRVRTHIYQTKETGRWSSARPALQNLCLDADTEFLTTSGWVLAPQLTAEHEVAQYWPTTKAIDFVRPTALIVKDYVGELCHLFGEQVDLMVTPNHRCLLRRRKSGKPFDVLASDFPVNTDNRQIHAGQYAGGTGMSDTALVRWLVAAQADGSYVRVDDKDYGLRLNLKKQRKIDRLDALLPLVAPAGSWSKTVKDGVTCYYLQPGKLVDITRQTLGPDKQLGSWVLQLTPEALQAFVEELPYWDGLSTRGTEYSSSDKTNADWAQIAWTLSGVRARMRLYRPKNPKAKDHYCVDWPVKARRRDFTEVTTVTNQQVPYQGKVYCVTVPSSYIVVRRNGKVAVTGNSKTRESDYSRILGPTYPYPLRSVMASSPGCCLVEADYIGAELYGAAMMAGDEKMIDHCLRNQLPEDDPSFYDIHSNVAVLSFGLKCEPTKAGLKAAGKKELRNVAKAIAFGLFYGRGAKAIALASKEQGYPLTEEEAQHVINTLFKIYPKLEAFFESCQTRATNPGWLSNAFGRYRRFEKCFDRKTQGDMERQAMNFPIQSLIADAVSRAMDHLIQYRKVVGDIYRVAMQVHDAILLEVPNEHVRKVVKKVLPHCMVKSVPIYPTDLAGKPTGTGPHYLGIDTEVCEYWGVHMMPDQCLARGFSPKLAHWHKQKTGWTHNDFPKQIWVPGQGLVSMEA